MHISPTIRKFISKAAGRKKIIACVVQDLLFYRQHVSWDKLHVVPSLLRPRPPPPTTHTNSHNFTVTRAECNKNVAVPRCAQAKKPPLKNPTVNTYPMPLHNDPYCRHVSGATVRVSLPQGVPGRVAAVRQQSEALGDDRARGDHLLPSGQLQVQVQTLGHEQI